MSLLNKLFTNDENRVIMAVSNQMENIMSDRRAIEVLNECAELMRSKGKAYNNIPQTTYYDLPAMMYKDGIGGEGSIYNMMHTKMIRILSLITTPDANNKFEGIEDSCRDLINYTAFMIEYLEGKMDE